MKSELQALLVRVPVAPFAVDPQAPAFPLDLRSIFVRLRLPLHYDTELIIRIVYPIAFS